MPAMGRRDDIGPCIVVHVAGGAREPAVEYAVRRPLSVGSTRPVVLSTTSIRDRRPEARPAMMSEIPSPLKSAAARATPPLYSRPNAKKSRTIAPVLPSISFTGRRRPAFGATKTSAAPPAATSPTATLKPARAVLPYGWTMNARVPSGFTASSFRPGHDELVDLDGQWPRGAPVMGGVALVDRGDRVMADGQLHL